MVASRISDHEIARLFIDRWSPRAFTDEVIPDATLLTCFEAARWAPSGFNLQPWRFIYAKRGGAGWDGFLSFLGETNRLWAPQAAALILFVSQTKVIWNGEQLPAITHSFDTGAAWSNFAHQASLLGWHTHAMGGFDRDKARALLGVPADFALEAVAAIGRLGEAACLPPKLREREAPSDRRALAQSVMEGRFQTL